MALIIHSQNIRPAGEPSELMSTGHATDRNSAEAAIVNLIPSFANESELSVSPSENVAAIPGDLAMTFGEFVQFRFVPEYVASRSIFVRSHLFAILKYVLTPERVSDAFGIDDHDSRRPRRPVAHRPYMDSIPLEAITAGMIEDLMSEYLRLGYAGQTVAHIRSILRSIFRFAHTCGCHSGPNPATKVPVPDINRKHRHVLALEDLERLIPLMRYPEREIALITLMTGLQVTEVCGLQWKNVNISNTARLVDGDFMPPQTLAIRSQSYRGTLGPVSQRRREIVSFGGLLNAVLRDQMKRGKFTGLEDFVLCSRNGTPINPDNIALRRLKPIGAALQMPWLSWKVFRNTRANLTKQLWKSWNEQLAQTLRFN